MNKRRSNYKLGIERQAYYCKKKEKPRMYTILLLYNWRYCTQQGFDRRMAYMLVLQQFHGTPPQIKLQKTADFFFPDTLGFQSQGYTFPKRLLCLFPLLGMANLSLCIHAQHSLFPLSVPVNSFSSTS